MLEAVFDFLDNTIQLMFAYIARITFHYSMPVKDITLRSGGKKKRNVGLTIAALY
jgi:hypothetical protein